MTAFMNDMLRIILNVILIVAHVIFGFLAFLIGLFLIILTIAIPILVIIVPVFVLSMSYDGWALFWWSLLTVPIWVLVLIGLSTND